MFGWLRRKRRVEDFSDNTLETVQWALAHGYAVEINSRYRWAPVDLLTNTNAARDKEEFNTLGARVFDAWHWATGNPLAREGAGVLISGTPCPNQLSGMHMTKPTNWRCLYITESTVQADAGMTYRTPEGSLDNLDALLHRLVSRLHPRGATVILADGAHELLGFPKHFRRAVKDHPALNRARAAGWEVSEVSPWMTFHRKDIRGPVPKIHIGIDPWLSGDPEEGNFSLKDETSPALTQLRMVKFHQLLGVPYYGTNAGLPGIDLLHDYHKGAVPTWCPKNWDKVEPALVPTEVATVGWKSSVAHDLPYEHQFDARLQYLSAAIAGEFALAPLEHVYVTLDGRVDLRGSGFLPPVSAGPAQPLPGYYLVTVPPFREAHRMPHPLGDHQPGDRVWIAAPTLQLAYQLSNTNDPWMDFPEVHDAWVARGSRVLRYWGEAIRDAVKRASDYGDDVLTTAVKMVYKGGIGMLATDTGRIRRPDWEHTVKAVARANLFRKLWSYAQTYDRWPVEIDYDAVWYASRLDTPVGAEWPAVFPDKTGPGGFRHQGTRKVAA